MDDQNPLRTALAKELNDSTWLQQFRSLSRLLQLLTSEVPLTEQCKLEWLSEVNTLRIDCPTAAVQQALGQKAPVILQINQQVNELAAHIVLKHEQHEVVLQ